jgi:hypothetical protein
MFIQQLVDELVDKWLGDGSTPAHKWLTPSVPASTLPREVRQASAGATAGGADQQEMVSPLEALMRTLEHMVNPSGRIGRTKWEFRSTGQVGSVIVWGVLAECAGAVWPIATQIDCCRQTMHKVEVGDASISLGEGYVTACL